MIFALFEDDKVLNFAPLTLTRAFFDLRVGAYTFIERFSRLMGRPELVIVRGHLEGIYEERGFKTSAEELDDDIFLVNPRYILDGEVVRDLRETAKSGINFTMFHRGDLVAANIPRNRAPEVVELLKHGRFREAYSMLKDVFALLETRDAFSVVYPWQLIELNAGVLGKDLEEMGGAGGEVDETVRVLGGGRLVVDEGAVVEPYVVVDTTHGPVYVGKNSVVHSFTYIEGPAYIGEGSVVMPRSILREGTNIGNVCRVGGEVEESIIHGYSNKYHSGFLGHAYVGEWVNIAALTTNSDLKNTYGTVKVRVGGERVDTGLRKVGAFIGDMVKTSIGVQIYTGKKIGVSSHVHGVVYEDVPSFTIYARSLGAEPVELRLESAIETQRKMMERRGLTLSKAYEEMIRRLFEMTEPERASFGVKKARFSFPGTGA